MLILDEIEGKVIAWILTFCYDILFLDFELPTNVCKNNFVTWV